MPQTGYLLPRITAQSRQALASGALQPIETRAEVVPDKGVDFVVRSVSSLRRKPVSSPVGSAVNDPFMPPYERDLFVGDLSDTHAALLNKYNVLANHLLIITRAYEAQERWLTRADFEALLICLGEMDGLGLYNGGREAGASQPHKHLQIVPLPLASVGPAVPLEPLFDRTRGGSIKTVPELPFMHAVARTPDAWWRSPGQGADAALETYHTLLEAVRIPVSGAFQSVPYNVLMTRRWMWVVPRSQGVLNAIPVNGVSYAGALLARDAADMAWLRRHGPLRVLASVGVPPPREALMIKR